MKIACLSDLHFSKERADDALKAILEFRVHITEEPVDLIAISGDIWDASVLNTEASYFDRFVESIQGLADLAPVVMIYGTPSHDTDGSLEVFKRVQSRCGITVMEPGSPYFLNRLGSVLNDSEQTMSTVTSSLLILGIPEPRKKYLLANGTAGKDETEEAVRNAMHQLCFQLAAIRAQYKDLPCLVVYHGDVAGTKLQNDETVERGTGIAITIDELADIGADYFHLGHIHKPQQVGNLLAYYAGSIYAKNFGEAHKPGWNLVEIGEWPVDETGGNLINSDPVLPVNVTRIDFSHPQNLKINIGFNHWDADFYDVIGRRSWVEISCKKEEQALVDAEKVLSTLMKAGAAPGSRVTVSVQAVETVRAAEIAEASTPEKKLEVWGENSAVEITEGMKAKLKTLLDTLDLSKVTIYGEWELLSVRIRGSLGIYLGIGKEEISVNFENLNDGLVAVTGVTGKGKSSFIENCHAYPQMFTKKGKLKDQFYKRDSFREVIYRNHVDGSEKRFLIQVDGETKSGSCRYFIFDRAKGETKWTAMTGVDGNLAPYTNAVNALFGPVELFLRTAFTIQKAQKDFPDITDANENEKKALFSALVGTDYLQTIADGAFSEGKKVEAVTHDAEVRISALESTVTGKNELADEMLRLADEKNTLADQLVQTKESGTAAKNRVESLQKAAGTERLRAQKEATLETTISGLENEIREIKSQIATYEGIASHRGEYESAITEYDRLKALLEIEIGKQREVEKRNQAKIDAFRAAMDEFNAKKAGIEQDFARAKDARREKEKALEAGNQTKVADYQKAVEEFNAKKSALAREVSDARIALGKGQADAAQIQSSIQLVSRDATIFNENCPTCGQKLPVDKLAELTRKREEALQRIDVLRVEELDQNNAIASMQARLNELEADLTGIEEDKPVQAKAETLPADDPAIKLVNSLNVDLAGIEMDRPEQEKLETIDGSEVMSLNMKLSGIDVNASRSNLTRAAESSARIEGFKAQINDRNRQIVAKQGELDEVIAGRNPDAIEDLTLGEKQLNELMEQYRKLTADLATNQAQLEAQRKRLAEIEAQETELAKLRDSIVTSKSEAAEWDLLRRAFGPDGIQALELDALAPGIAEDTNSRIKAAYGDRFKIEFRTTRIAGTGSKTKQVEDFSILVHDTEKGNIGLLENKSGGEFSEIKRALYDSFTAMRAKNSNFRFLTRFLDEADGALDAASRTNYCRMLEADHESGKYRNTIIITHSDEVKAMISQKIEMEALAESAGAGKTEEAEYALEAAV